MEFNSRTEFAIFFYTLHHPELVQKCQKEFFSDDTMRGLYEISSPFVLKYKKCPTSEEVKQLIENSDWTPQQHNKITDETVDLLWGDSETYQTLYDPVWMTEQVEAFYRYQTLMLGVRETISFVKVHTDDLTVDNIKEMSKKIQKLFEEKTTVNFVNENLQLHLLSDPETYKGDDYQHFSSGDSFIDTVSGGGYWPGSLWVWIGAPKAGKSRLMENLCVDAFRQGYDTAYVSFELTATAISHCISSNFFDFEMLNWKDNKFADEKNAKLVDDYVKSHPDAPEASILEFPQSSLTVHELENYLLTQEKMISEKKSREFHFRVIYLDYLNILKADMDSENTYLTVKQITSDLKSIAQKHGWCIVSATQPKAQYFQAETLDMNSVSESSALQANVDMLWGIISTKTMEFEHCQYLKIILNRVESYKNVKQKYLVDDSHMRLVKSDDAMVYESGAEKNTKSGYRQSKSRVSKTIPQTTTNTINPMAGQLGSIVLGSIKIK